MLYNILDYEFMVYATKIMIPCDYLNFKHARHMLTYLMIKGVFIIMLSLQIVSSLPRHAHIGVGTMGALGAGAPFIF